MIMSASETVDLASAPYASVAGLQLASVHYELHDVELTGGRFDRVTPPRRSFAEAVIAFGGTWFFGIFLTEVGARWFLGFDPGWSAATAGFAFACVVALVHTVLTLSSHRPRHYPSGSCVRTRARNAALELGIGSAGCDRLGALSAAGKFSRSAD